MGSWTSATVQSTPAGVILHRRSFDRQVRRLLAAPSPRFADVVETFWGFSWTRAVTLPSSLVPQFSVNLTRELNSGRPGSSAGVVITGVPTGRFDVDLAGAGYVIGVKFHPGAFAALSTVPASELTDRTIAAADLLPAEVIAAFAHVTSDPPVEGDGEQIAGIEQALTPLLPTTLPEPCTRARMALRSARDPQILRVDQLAAAADVSVRGLQRMFDRWIGVPPKQVITRMRLHDAVSALDEDSGETLADLAARLGFFDQAHFTREFTHFVGVSPARYIEGGRPGPVTPDPA